MAEQDPGREGLIPVGDSMQPILPPSAVPRPASQIGLILWALICSNIFALFITLIFEFLSLRGVVDVSASRFVLVAAGISGVVIICAFAWGKGIRAKWQTVSGGSLLLVVMLWGLDVWAPKPAIIVDPTHLAFDAALPSENFGLTVQNKTDFYAYSVQVKMKFSQLSATDFTFDTPSPRAVVEGSKLADIQGVRCTDRNKRAVVMFWIYRMEPHSTREISITHNSNSTAVIDSKLTYFTVKPVPRTGDKIHATGTFHFDEPLTCNGDIMFQLPTPPASAGSSPRPPPKQVSFFYIYPGLYFPTPGSNGEHTSMVMYFGHHGPENLFNLKVIMTDASRLLKHLPPTSEEIIQAKTYQSLPELDAAGFGAGGPAGFQWNLIDNDHAEFNFELSHRAGHLRELLKVRKVGDHWNKAIFVANFTSNDPLLACRDTEFPPDESFSAKLKPCERPTF